jgi:energy-coupling factor transporter ATP-binding protein EcfA2
MALMKRAPARSPAPVSKQPSFAGIEDRIVPVSEIKTPMRLAIYGRAGSGKTTLASSFPAALLLDIKEEQGTASVADVKGLQVFPVEDWDDLEQVYWFLESGKHKFKTLILDTVTQMQELAITRVLEKKKKDVEDAGGWGTLTKGDWGDVASLVKTWIMNFRGLKMNVVFIAQERVFNAGDEAGGEDGAIAPEVGPRLSPSVRSTLEAAVEVIGHAFVREKVTRKRGADKKIEETRVIQFCLRVGPHTYYTTKVRKPKGTITPAFLIDPTYEDLVELRAGE